MGSRMITEDISAISAIMGDAICCPTMKLRAAVTRIVRIRLIKYRKILDAKRCISPRAVPNERFMAGSGKGERIIAATNRKTVPVCIPNQTNIAPEIV
jgi:hypothetical protein